MGASAQRPVGSSSSRLRVEPQRAQRCPGCGAGSASLSSVGSDSSASSASSSAAAVVVAAAQCARSLFHDGALLHCIVVRHGVRRPPGDWRRLVAQLRAQREHALRNEAF